MPSIDLTHRVALVTGGSRGIGRAIAIALAEAGAAVAVNYRAQKAEADATVAAIRSAGGCAEAFMADVSDGGSVTALVTDIAKALGPVDILVNNAGIAVIRSLDDLTEEEFDQTISVNLKSAFLCTRAVLPHMRAQKWGRIVNISSGAARGSGIVGVHYNASKAGMEGLTRGYATRLTREGVTVNAVAPSLIDTDMISIRQDDSAAKVPMGRLGTSEECAQATLMVIGNAYMTGQTIQVNGGMHFI
jgi:3-oxoacyl-[acyl-carrier protein] reductase